MLFVLGNDLISCAAGLKRVHRIYLHFFLLRLFPDAPDVDIPPSVPWHCREFEDELAGRGSRLLKHIAIQGKNQEFIESRFEDIFWMLSALSFALGSEVSASGDQADDVNIELWKTVDMEASKLVFVTKKLKGLDARISSKLYEAEGAFKVLLSSYDTTIYGTTNK